MPEYRMKEGHPPFEELMVRYTISRTYGINPEDYPALPENDIAAATNAFEAMLYDGKLIEAGETTEEELLRPDEPGADILWEVVDKDGIVWSERIDESEEPLGDLDEDEAFRRRLQSILVSEYEASEGDARRAISRCWYLLDGVSRERVKLEDIHSVAEHIYTTQEYWRGAQG